MINPTFLASCLAACALLAACSDRDAEESTTSVVLIDSSASINPGDRLIYEQSIAALAAELRGGDRLMVGRIGDQGRSDFRPLLDLTVSRTEIRIDQEKGLRAARAALVGALPQLLSSPDGRPAQRTRIVEAIAAAAEVFGPPPNNGDRIVILSDGVEDSSFGRLDRIHSDGGAENMLERMRSAGLLANLSGVSLSVIGAGGENYATIHRFWQSFAAETGARIDGYGRLPYHSGSERTRP